LEGRQAQDGAAERRLGRQRGEARTTRRSLHRTLHLLSSIIAKVRRFMVATQQV
jgi:hypothetical protein